VSPCLEIDLVNVSAGIVSLQDKVLVNSPAASGRVSICMMGFDCESTAKPSS